MTNEQYERAVANIHVLPLEDLKEHLDNSECECKPQLKEGVWVHNSWDKREYFEEDTNKVLPRH